MNYLAIFFILFTLVKGDYTDGGWKIYHRAPLYTVACAQIIGKNALYFKETDPLGWCNKDNQPALGTMAHALTLTNSTKAINYFVKDCNKINPDGFTLDDFNFAFENATKYLVANASAEPGFNITLPFNKPVAIKQAKIDAAVHSSVSRYQNMNYGSIFGLVLSGYWFFLIILSGIWNLLAFITPSFVKKFSGSFSNKVRKHITLPALFGKKHNDYFYVFGVFPILIPTRWESIMLGVYWILVLAFNVCDFHHNVGNTIWVKVEAEMGRKIADRTGYMVIFMYPTLVLFAGRNNFLQLFSGWSYSRFILIHKWIARAVTLLSLVHAIGMTYNGKGIGNGKYEQRNAKPYVRWGYVAFIAMAIMLVQAMNLIRKNRYEIFVLVHIILAVIVLVGSWIHVSEDMLQPIYYSAAAVWVFDRVVRIGRLFAFGVRKAKVQLIADETLKVTVKRPSYWKPFAGAHAFVHFLRPSCFWQSHPFTIVDEVSEKNTITFYLKVKGGMTHGLYQYLKKQPNQISEIPISVEGPYGHQLPLSRYDSQIFISSGNGIPGLYEEAKQLVQKKTSNLNMKFIWIIRHYKSIEWFYQELVNLEHPSVDVEIYITNGSAGVHKFWDDSSSDLNSNSEKNSEELNNEKTDEIESIIGELKSKLSHVKFIEQRPVMDDLLSKEIEQANNGTIAISTCCHTSIDDDIRRSLVNNLDKSQHRIDLYDQIQVW